MFVLHFLPLLCIAIGEFLENSFCSLFVSLIWEVERVSGSFWIFWSNKLKAYRSKKEVMDMNMDSKTHYPPPPPYILPSAPPSPPAPMPIIIQQRKITDHIISSLNFMKICFVVKNNIQKMRSRLSDQNQFVWSVLTVVKASNHARITKQRRKLIAGLFASFWSAAGEWNRNLFQFWEF